MTAPIEAARMLSAPPDRVFEFLSDLRNHWRLEDRFVELVGLRDEGTEPPTGGWVRIKGPLGISRTARTKVVGVEAPHGDRGAAALRGIAEVGRTTLGNVRWDIQPPGEDGSLVKLSAEVARASGLDRALLALGGRLWLAEIFVRALDNLALVLEDREASRRCGSGSGWVEDGLVAGAVAAAVGALPSTIDALLAHRDPLESTLAAGSLLLPRAKRPFVLAAAAVPVHLSVSLG